MGSALPDSLRIVDFDDRTFDPFKTYDETAGIGEIDTPYPRFKELMQQGLALPGSMREEVGLQPFALWADLPSYMVFGHEAVSAIFRDGVLYSNAIMQRIYNDSFGQSINGMDPPEHTRYRRLFQAAFMPQVIARWAEHLIPSLVNQFIDQFADRSRAELVSEFTIRYPFQFVYGQLDLPKKDQEVFHKLAVGLMCITTDYPHGLEASLKMRDYFAILLEERREHPGEDLVSILATAEVEGERLPDDVAISFLRQLMNAGGDTTYRSFGNLLVGLLTHPDQLEAVRQDRSLVPKAVEEALRWEPTLTMLTRSPTQDVEIHGLKIPAGAKIDVMSASANRDPSRYENPEKFDIFRKPERHFAFAFGPHVCIGQHLARMEMVKALDGLLDRLPNLRLDPHKPPPKITGLSLRMPTEVHVVFD